MPRDVSTAALTASFEDHPKVASLKISSWLFTDLERWSCARLSLEFLKARVVVPERGVAPS